METTQFHIHGATGDSTICIGEGLDQVQQYIPPGDSLIIADNNVWQHHQARFPELTVIRIDARETLKSLATVEGLYSRFLEHAADRSTFVVGVGGGVVCDIAGFAAATYMRGLRYGFVATTLLAQVDASVGGKNGVNFQGYKNLVGVFRQPEFVLCDLTMLKTLPETELVSGMGEVVKHALIADAPLFDFLERNTQGAVGLDPNVIQRMVIDSVRIKSTVVAADETEQGMRRILNFGHTVGHALEKLARIQHGAAVSVGMVMASRISMLKGYLTPEDVRRTEQLLQGLSLPISTPETPEHIMDAIGKDKKRVSDRIHFVLLKRIGKAVVEEIPLVELRAMLSEIIGG